MSHLFVGHVFSTKQIDELRPALRAGIPMAGGELWFADEHPGTGPLLAKVFEGIDAALACVFEISDSTRANVFFELGYALGRNKPCVLICRRGTEIPTDLKGFEFLVYESYRDLTQQLLASMGARLGGISLSKAAVRLLANSIQHGPILRNTLFAEAERQGVDTVELETVLAKLEQDEIIGISGEEIQVLNGTRLSELDSLAAQ